MARTHISGPWVTNKGYEQKISGAYKTVVDADGSLYNKGAKLVNDAEVVAKSKTIVFDTIGAAGVYTGDILVPAGAVIENIIVHNVALTNAGTSAVMDVGDFTTAATPVAIDANGFFAAIDLKETDLLAGESVDLYYTGGKQGVYSTLTTNAQNAASHIKQRYAVVDRYIRGVVTTVGAASTTGKVLMTVIYNAPEPVSATFAAS